jgi:hypothetical protein
LPLALLLLCAQWPALQCDAQTSAGSSQARPPRTEEPEERVDIIAPETYLIPMRPAVPIPVLSVQKVDGGAVFTMQPGVMKVSLAITT